MLRFLFVVWCVLTWPRPETFKLRNHKGELKWYVWLIIPLMSSGAVFVAVIVWLVSTLPFWLGASLYVLMGLFYTFLLSDWNHWNGDGARDWFVVASFLTYGALLACLYFWVWDWVVLISEKGF